MRDTETSSKATTAEDGTVENAANEASTGGLGDHVTLGRIANVVGLLVLIAVVVPFTIYAVPQVVGASESYVVLSGSMEPAMSPGDAIVVEDVSPGQVAEGDVITFSRESEARPTTHRVVGVLNEGEGTLFVTKGDANEEADQNHVQPSQLEGRVMSVGGYLFVIPYIGYVLEFAKTQTGFGLLFVLPIGLFLANEVYTFVRGGSGQPTAGDASGDGTGSTQGIDSEVADGEGAATDGSDEIDGADGVGSASAETDAADGVKSATAAGEETESDGTYSLDPTEFRMGLLVMAVFAGYSVWVAYTLTEPWSVGSAAAVVMATVLFGSLYVFGEPADPDDVDESADGSDMHAAPAESADEPGPDTAKAPNPETRDETATDPADGQQPTRTVSTDPSVGTRSFDEPGRPSRATDDGRGADGESDPAVSPEREADRGEDGREDNRKYRGRTDDQRARTRDGDGRDGRRHAEVTRSGGETDD